MKGLDAVMQGIATDGGLFVPIKLPHFEIDTMLEDDYPLLAMRILQPFFPDINPLTLEEMISKAISNFATPEVTPLREHQDRIFWSCFMDQPWPLKMLLYPFFLISMNWVNQSRAQTSHFSCYFRR
jgi:threonine synthase